MEFASTLAAQITAGMMFAAVLLMVLVPMLIAVRHEKQVVKKQGKLLSFRQYRRKHK